MHYTVAMAKGDPGLFGSIFRAASNFIPGPLGYIARRVAGGSGRPQLPVFGQGGLGPSLNLQPGMPTISGSLVSPGPVGPGAGTGMTVYQGGGVVSPMGTHAKCPPGYHVNKALERAARSATPGNVRRAGQVVHACVKNRRMNVANIHALRRSIRRARGFLHLARSVVHLTSSPGGQHRVPHFKAHRRKRIGGKLK